MSAHRQQRRRWPVLLLGASLLVISGCGGGSGGGRTTPPSSAPTITTSSLPDAMSGQAYSQKLTATGGKPPYTWSLQGGGSFEILVPGLQLSSDGVISGTPEPAQGSGTVVAHFTVVVTDSALKSASRDMELYVTDPLAIKTTSLPDGNVGLQYSAAIVFSGGLHGIVCSLATGSQPLPPGLMLSSSDCLVSGIPTAGGTFTFTIQIQDHSTPAQTATGTIRLFIDNHVFIDTEILPDGVVNLPYRGTLEASAGTPPYTWTATGVLPAGLTLSASGEVSGTPTQAQDAYVDFTVTDSSVPAGSSKATVLLRIHPPLTFQVLGQNPDAVRGTDYSAGFNAWGGMPPISMRLKSGTLPPGLSLKVVNSQDGLFEISGVPTGTGTFNFTLEATDSYSTPSTVQQDETIRIFEPLAITTTSLPEGWTADPYSATLKATGGALPYHWFVVSLPQGLVLDESQGQISGVPTEAWNQDIVASLTDSALPHQYATLSLPLKIIGRLAITTSRLPAARPGVPYRVSLGLFGGTAPFNWSLTSGALALGLSLNASTGQITGTPTREETANFTVQLKDSGPPLQTATRALSLRIASALGRNDTIATATPISSGTFRASVSPYADPTGGPANPDTDYYALTALPGATVTVEVMAQRLIPPSPLDSVIEIVDASGTRYSTCRLPDNTYGGFVQSCMNDDIQLGVDVDSKLSFQVPGSGSTPVTFYVHLLDWGGNARPDYLYDLVVTGAN